MRRATRELHAIKNLNHIDISAEREGRAIKRLAEITPKTCEYRNPRPDDEWDAGGYHNARRLREDAPDYTDISGRWA